MIAKAVQGLLEASVPPAEIVRTGIEFGCTYRADGWGAGLTTLVAMANVLDRLDAADQTLALVHALAFVSRDTRGRAPRFAIEPLRTDDLDVDRLSRLVPALRRDPRRGCVRARARDRRSTRGLRSTDVEGFMEAAVTDHVFIDEGHTLDFTNKAFEALGHVGDDAAALVLPTLVRQTAARAAVRGVLGVASSPRPADARSPSRGRVAGRRGRRTFPQRGEFDDAAGLGWRLLDEDPEAVVDALLDAIRAGATSEQLGRALAYAASLRIVRFHVQNDFGDWNTVHHAFTAANALHQALVRAPTPELMRGARARRAARLPRPLPERPRRSTPDLRHRRPRRARGVLGGAGSGRRRGPHRVRVHPERRQRSRLGAALGHALLGEDTEFHWFQVYEASMRQVAAWPEGSEEAALILTGTRSVPRRPHADAARAADRRPHRPTPPPRRSPLRRRLKPVSGRGRDRCRRQGRSA